VSRRRREGARSDGNLPPRSRTPATLPGLSRGRETAGVGALCSGRRGEASGEEMAARKAREGVSRALYCPVGVV
jgi:hypothetical protein